MDIGLHFFVNLSFLSQTTVNAYTDQQVLISFAYGQCCAVVELCKCAQTLALDRLGCATQSWSAVLTTVGNQAETRFSLCKSLGRRTGTETETETRLERSILSVATLTV